MSFLKLFIHESETLNIDRISDMSEENNCPEEDDRVDNLKTIAEKEIQIQSEEQSATSFDIPQTFRTSVKRKFKSKEFNEIPSSTLMKYIIEQNKCVLKSKDPVDAFFSSITETVKTFTPIYQNTAKSRIFNIVSQLEMELLMKKHPEQKSTIQSAKQSSHHPVFSQSENEQTLIALPSEESVSP